MRGWAAPGRARVAVRLGLVLSCSFVGAACAPSLAGLQPAHVAPAGHVQAAAAFELGVPTGAIHDVVETSRTLGEIAQTQTISTAQRAQLLDAGMSLAASPPAFGPHFALAYGAVPGVELGLRYAVGTWRLGTRYQLLDRTSGPCDLVVGLGLSRSSQGVPADEVLQVVSIDDVTRWTLDVPLLAGTGRSWYRAWIGPKLLFSTLSTAVRLDLAQGEVVAAGFAGRTLYYGGQAGFAIGYRNVFLALELTVARMAGSAHIVDGTAEFVNRSIDLTGTAIYPAVGLIGEL